jgi:hypothetical protein
VVVAGGVMKMVRLPARPMKGKGGGGGGLFSGGEAIYQQWRCRVRVRVRVCED